MDKNQIHALIRSFLAEDIGRGDLTSESIFDASQAGQARLIAREACIAAGAGLVAAEVFKVQNPEIETASAVEDGTAVQPGDSMLTIAGPVVDMLKAERVALNLLQRLCGIATLTRRFVEKITPLPARITDTRKTTPGLRVFEKYAVQVGGGCNHRFNLTDGVLIKDNHIAACGSITAAVEKVRKKIPHTTRIEVETDTLVQVQECLACGVDIIMLDNMDLQTMRQAVEQIGRRALVEASGGVNLGSVSAIAGTGVDIISVGALTHSAPSCDIGMDWV
ncbi:MAG: carboxylating nicotinate-nucleotide diphosphorylase [Desulfocapsaceae bacterium]|nr:carboxylating nicotinate-nucleotide diphosphorylase [Desulfocapsaceae bacterium]